jgi:hypothetical protein
MKSLVIAVIAGILFGTFMMSGFDYFNKEVVIQVQVGTEEWVSFKTLDLKEGSFTYHSTNGAGVKVERSGQLVKIYSPKRSDVVVSYTPIVNKIVKFFKQ